MCRYLPAAKTDGKCLTGVPARKYAVTFESYAVPFRDRSQVVLHVYPEEDHSGTVLASLVDSTPFLREAFQAT
jgi:hypothetical protein